MISFIKEWANQIIVAVIIATIFEMILPNSNNKKYIKMIIGIYVLFTVIQPIAQKLTGKEITISAFNYEKYFDEDILETSSENFDNNNSKLIEQAYIDNIKSDITAKIEQRGYKVTSCDINISSSESEYGVIKKIELRIKSIEKQLQEDNNIVEIDKVEVEINNNRDVIEKSNIAKEEKEEIIEYLASEYSITKTNIIIN